MMTAAWHCDGQLSRSQTSSGTCSSLSSLQGSVNEYHLWMGRQRQVQLIPLADETQSVQVELCYPLTMRAIPERLRDASRVGAIQIGYLYLFTLPSLWQVINRCLFERNSTSMYLVAQCNGVDFRSPPILSIIAPLETRYLEKFTESIQLCNNIIHHYGENF